MKELTQRFNLVSKENPNHSTFINFLRTVSGQKYPESTVRRSFSKLVEKDDYAKSDKSELLDFVCSSLAKSTPRSKAIKSTILNGIRGKNASKQLTR